MSMRFRAREFHRWSRRDFMLRAVQAMLRDGPVAPADRRRVRESFHRIACEDDRLRRLIS